MAEHEEEEIKKAPKEKQDVRLTKGNLLHDQLILMAVPFSVNFQNR